MALLAFCTKEWSGTRYGFFGNGYNKTKRTWGIQQADDVRPWADRRHKPVASHWWHFVLMICWCLTLRVYLWCV